MKHLIMGTAGHVDHGKTALIKALTGIDCDTHKEEKARGITINLGFAHVDLPSGDSLGIVDVPGHRDFVHTMVGGAGGIDLALLVVAADSGVMPQTREHLRIMEVLQVRGGLAALTKIDLVEPDLVEVAAEEVRELMRGSFLDGCPVVPVSPVTGEGLEALRDAIGEVASRLEDRPVGEVFRLFIDRIFVVSGFGTVVTGSVMSGRLRAGDAAYLLPGEQELRVRRLERHGKETDEVRAGDRASINLVGLNREDFKRGMMISDRRLPATGMVDAKLHLFPGARGLGLWSRVVFHLGTHEGQARVHLLDRDRIRGGETALVQIHLEERAIVPHGARFVIRSSSNDLTLGGGEVIDATPLHHRRRSAQLVRSLENLSGGRVPELVASEVRKRSHPVSGREVADALGLSADRVRRALSELLPEDVVPYASDDELYLITRSRRDRLAAACLESIGAFHQRHPLEERGQPLEEMLSLLPKSRSPSAGTVLRHLLEELEAEGKVKRVGHTWTLAGHTVRIGPERERRLRFVADLLKGCGMKTPLITDLERAAGREGIDRREIDLLLRHLVRKGEAYLAEGSYIHASVVDRCREAALRALARRPGGLTVAQFRDLVAGNRRICLLLLGLYDAEGVTRREGDVRFLTEKGKAALQA